MDLETLPLTLTDLPSSWLSYCDSRSLAALCLSCRELRSDVGASHCAWRTAAATDWGCSDRGAGGPEVWRRCLARYGAALLRDGAFARARALWSRVEAWAEAASFPLLLASLRPGATREDIAFMERVLGLQLPAALVALLLLHDGQHGASLTAGPNLPPIYTAGIGGGMFVYDLVRSMRILGCEEILYRTLELRTFYRVRPLRRRSYQNLVVIAVSTGKLPATVGDHLVCDTRTGDVLHLDCDGNLLPAHPPPEPGAHSFPGDGVLRWLEERVRL